VRKVWRLSAALSLATFAGSLGCSSSSTWLSNPLTLGKSRSGSKFADAPAFSYEELASKQADRKVSSPGLGMDQDVEPGRMKRMTNSVTNNPVSKGIKSAWTKTSRKTGELFTTHKEAANPISLSVDTGDVDADLHVSLARLDEAKGNFKAAEKRYQDALADDSDHLNALIGMARLHDRRGDLPKAAAYYNQAVKAHPEDATAHNDLGLCFARQNRLQEAARSLDRAVQLAPEKALYRNNIAKVLVELGQVEPAFTHLAAAHGDAVAHYNLACMLNERGETSAAIDHFSLAYEQDQSLTQAYDWAVALQNQTSPSTDEAYAANLPAEPSSMVTATDNRLASQPEPQVQRPVAPPLTSSWSPAADHSTFPAAAPSPDGVTGYAPAEPDPAAYGPTQGDLTHRLPPIDTAYRAPSRY
jgi:tetratricopeptide (TPR) repeat protein